MKNLLLLSGLLLSQVCFAQNWVDTTYQIATVSNIAFGSSIDFKGANYVLEMDISMPSDDIPPECGRPLMVVVHGGAWYGGDKVDGYAVSLRTDFAKRGFVTASVNYRQGLFNTNQNIDCALLDGWKCWNMTDTTEWYRANYRAIQDVHGAIRFLVNEKETYHINPDNLFLVGESAGGFVVLGAGFIDDSSEVLEELIDVYPDALPPHPIYEGDCIQQFGLAENIAEMDLSRPNLGDVAGDINFPVQENYRIRGVGSFYGAAFNNIFETKSTTSPALYLYHQPCDLIVPFNQNKLLSGYSTCATGFPTFCQHIVNRPFVYGSNAIVALIEDMEQNNVPTCEYMFDNSGNTYSCLDQVVNPNLGCHAIDNYALRTTNMATFFAERIAECATTETTAFYNKETPIILYPNPSGDWINLKLREPAKEIKISIIDVLGQTIINSTLENQDEYRINISSLTKGYYQIMIEMGDQKWFHPIIKQ